MNKVLEILNGLKIEAEENKASDQDDERWEGFIEGIESAIYKIKVESKEPRTEPIYGDKLRQYGFCALYASRKSLQEAYDYAMSLINTLPAKHQIGPMTGLHVLVNTGAEMLAEESIKNYKTYTALSNLCIDLDRMEADEDYSVFDNWEIAEIKYTVEKAKEALS